MADDWKHNQSEPNIIGYEATDEIGDQNSRADFTAYGVSAIDACWKHLTYKRWWDKQKGQQELC